MVTHKQDEQKKKIFAVMGHPVSHSQSPAIHRQFANQFGFEIEYTAIDVEPGRFPEAVATFREHGGSGLNVTVPFKLEAFNLATRRSSRAEQAGAVNTLMFEDNDGVFGDNTDGVGLVRDLGDNLGITLSGARLLVVGAGGAVRGILGPLLATAPGELVIANRTVGKAEVLAQLFQDHVPVRACGLDAIDGQFDLVINGTTASLKGEIPALPSAIFGGDAAAYDLMYATTPTTFCTWAQQHGATRVADGLGMLVEQAAESFFIWFGQRPQTAPVIAALRQA